MAKSWLLTILKPFKASYAVFSQFILSEAPQGQVVYIQHFSSFREEQHKIGSSFLLSSSFQPPALCFASPLTLHTPCPSTSSLPLLLFTSQPVSQTLSLDPRLPSVTPAPLLGTPERSRLPIRTSVFLAWKIQCVLKWWTKRIPKSIFRMSHHMVKDLLQLANFWENCGKSWAYWKCSKFSSFPGMYLWCSTGFPKIHQLQCIVLSWCPGLLNPVYLAGGLYLNFPHLWGTPEHHQAHWTLYKPLQNTFKVVEPILPSFLYLSLFILHFRHSSSHFTPPDGLSRYPIKLQNL